MSFVPLNQLPWRNPASPTDQSELLASLWVTPADLISEVDQWRHWLADQPAGAWLLCERDPLRFSSALLALWETGRVAVLSADDRPETLARIADRIDGKIPRTRPDTPPCDSPLPETLHPQDQALVLFTSGSSGEPVALIKTFTQLAAELQVHAHLWPLDDSSAVVSQVSHQHIYGLLTGVLHPVCSGTPFCSLDCHFPEVLAQRLHEAETAQRKVTLVSSPPQLSRLPAHIQWPAPGSVVRVLSSGAPLELEHATHASALLHAPVIEIFGSTETGGIGWREQRLGAVWASLPGVEVRVEENCLALRSPFLPDPQAWWQHPDRIKVTGNGFLLLGREDRLVKVAGKRISLAQMENVLTDLEGIDGARCVELGRPDGRLGVIVVVAADNIPQEHAERRELVERLRGALANHFETVTLPRYWRFVETLPANSQGKLDRHLIQRLFNDIEDRKAPRWLGETFTSQHGQLLTLEVPEKLVFLDGHFDRFQLVPGVVLVQWAMQLGQLAFGERAGFGGVEQLKFQRPLRPGMRFTLQLTRRADGVAFIYESHEGRHAAGRILLAPMELTP